MARFALQKNTLVPGWRALQSDRGPVCKDTDFEVLPVSEVEPLVEAARELITSSSGNFSRSYPDLEAALKSFEDPQ